MKASARSAGILVLLLGLPTEAKARHPPLAWDRYAITDSARNGVIVIKPWQPSRVRIAAGHFMMGSTPNDVRRALDFCQMEIMRSRCDEVGAQLRSELIAHAVELSSFWIDRTEVTVERYAGCVAAHACAPPSFVANDPRFDRPNFPVTHVRWEDADAYCRFAHGRLPTEAEWEYAARGSTGRMFPWGNIYNSHLANHGAFAADDTDGSDGFIGLAPVGSFPDGATISGLLDMAGNVAEWVADFYDVDEKGMGYKDRPEENPKGPPTGSLHPIRGGSYRDGAAWIRATARGFTSLPSAPTVGFRCASDQ